MPRLLCPLPPTVAVRLRAAEDVLLQQVLDAARASSETQGRPLGGAAGRGVRTGVRAAVDEFLELVADPEHDLGPAREVFRQLGREEFRDGRFIDALRSTLGAGTQAIWTVLVDLGKAHEIEPDHLHVLAGALFPFLDQLTAAAAEGYLEEQERTSIDFGMTRRRCVLTLIQSVQVDENAQRKAAEAARWQLPDRVGVLLVEGTDADRLARMTGADSIGATLEDTAVVIVPEADAPGRLTHLQRVVTGRRAALGSTVPLSRARESYRQAVHALRLLDNGAIEAAGLVVCADHLLTLILGWEEGLTDRFAEQALHPLQRVPKGHRRTLEDTLLTWLQHQGRVVPTAESLHAHPQTIRYRLRQLRTVFGDALDDPDGRYRLETALRWRVLSRP
jgi:hypothetical protein